MAQGVIDKSAEIKRAITDGIRREFRAE